jgi:hypothetical protein
MVDGGGREVVAGGYRSVGGLGCGIERAANLRVRVGDPIAADLSRRTSGTTAALPASSSQLRRC